MGKLDNSEETPAFPILMLRGVHTPREGIANKAPMVIPA
jgi:hypothetical protein